VVPSFHLIVREIKARFTPLFALEFGMASLALEERRKGFAQVQHRLIRSILRDFPRPGELLPPDLVELLRCRFKAVGFSPAAYCRFHSANAQFQTNRLVPAAFAK
jgi:hypothetical protein